MSLSMGFFDTALKKLRIGFGKRHDDELGTYDTMDLL